MEIQSPFLFFSDDRQETCCCFLLPVSAGSDVVLKSPDSPDSFSFEITNIAGITIGTGYSTIVSATDEPLIIPLFGIDLSVLMAPGDCFRIKTGNLFSNPFLYIGCNTENTCLFEFWDNKDAIRQKVRLSCVLDKPQSKTEKSEYTDANGIVHSLSKTRRKEYELSIDFYPEAVHDAIKEMLSHPFLMVDGIAMYESGDYEIEWDEKDENGHARATTKLSEQNTGRFSICE
jgi:hypothetical protein